MDYIKQTYLWNVEDNAWFDVKSLIYNSTQTRFESNSSISMIVKEIMIEQWNPSYFYDIFYHLCSPSYCIYSQKVHTNNAIGIVVILLSVIGGLTVSLRLIALFLVVFIRKLISIVMKEQKQEQQPIDINWWIRLKLIRQNVMKSLYEILIHLNIFPYHTFGNNIDRKIVQHLGQLATRLFLLLLIVSFAIISIYTLTQQQILTKDFREPSFDTYN